MVLLIKIAIFTDLKKLFICSTLIDLTPITNSKKQTLLPQRDRRGFFDSYRCKHCGLEGKARSLSVISVRYNKKCTNVRLEIKIERIKIIRCSAFGEIFSNLVPESEHDVIDPPDPYKPDRQGVWVMGNGQPVKVLSNEFEIIEK